MEHKRIVIISEKYYACGASMAAFRLADGLAEAGWDVHYLFVQPTNKGAKPPFHALQRLHYYRGTRNLYERIKVRVLNKFLKKKIATQYCPDASFDCAKAYIEKVQPDYINVHNTELTHVEVMQLQNFAPVIWTLHDLYPLFGYNYSATLTNGNKIDYIPNKIQNNLGWEQALTSLISAGVKFTGPSQWICNEADSAGANNSTKIVNPISPYEFFPIDRGIAKSLLGLDANKKIILFIQGRYAFERKNIQSLVDYLDSPDANKRNNLLFIVVGAKLESGYRSRQDIKYVNEIKGLKTLREYYSAANYTCIPSLEENYPNVGIESAYCGTPIIGSNRGGIPEQINIIPGSKIFDPYKKESFFDVMEEISVAEDNDGTLAQQQALHALVYDLHNRQMISEQFLNLLTDSQ